MIGIGNNILMGNAGGLTITGYTATSNVAIDPPSMTVTVTGEDGAQYSIPQFSAGAINTIPISGANQHTVTWARAICNNSYTQQVMDLLPVAPTIVDIGVPVSLTSNAAYGYTTGGAGTTPAGSPTSGSFSISSGQSFTVSFTGGAHVNRILTRLSGSAGTTYFTPSAAYLYANSGSVSFAWKAAGSGGRALYINVYYEPCYTGTANYWLGPSVQTI